MIDVIKVMTARITFCKIRKISSDLVHSLQVIAEYIQSRKIRYNQTSKMHKFALIDLHEIKKIMEKVLRVGESNPGRPRDRREYSPLY